MQPRLLTLAAATLFISAVPAAAQRRVPNTGMWALGGSIGAGMPTISPVFLDGNLVYNWEGGKWHPYVTGGLGMYRYRSRENLAPATTDTSLGADFGGGLEFFSSRRTAVTTEFLYHDVQQIKTPLTTFIQGQFWTFNVGLKRYF